MNIRNQYAQQIVNLQLDDIVLPRKILHHLLSKEFIRYEQSDKLPGILLFPDDEQQIRQFVVDLLKSLEMTGTNLLDIIKQMNGRAALILKSPRLLALFDAFFSAYDQYNHHLDSDLNLALGLSGVWKNKIRDELVNMLGRFDWWGCDGVGDELASNARLLNRNIAIMGLAYPGIERPLYMDCAVLANLAWVPTEEKKLFILRFFQLLRTLRVEINKPDTNFGFLDERGYSYKSLIHYACKFLSTWFHDLDEKRQAEFTNLLFDCIEVDGAMEIIDACARVASSIPRELAVRFVEVLSSKSFGGLSGDQPYKIYVFNLCLTFIESYSDKDVSRIQEFYCGSRSSWSVAMRIFDRKEYSFNQTWYYFFDGAPEKFAAFIKFAPQSFKSDFANELITAIDESQWLTPAVVNFILRIDDWFDHHQKEKLQAAISKALTRSDSVLQDKNLAIKLLSPHAENLLPLHYRTKLIDELCYAIREFDWDERPLDVVSAFLSLNALSVQEVEKCTSSLLVRLENQSDAIREPLKVLRTLKQCVDRVGTRQREAIKSFLIKQLQAGYHAYVALREFAYLLTSEEKKFVVSQLFDNLQDANDFVRFKALDNLAGLHAWLSNDDLSRLVDIHLLALSDEASDSPANPIKALALYFQALSLAQQNKLLAGIVKLASDIEVQHSQHNVYDAHIHNQLTVFFQSHAERIPKAIYQRWVDYLLTLIQAYGQEPFFHAISRHGKLLEAGKLADYLLAIAVNYRSNLRSNYIDPIFVLIELLAPAAIFDVFTQHAQFDKDLYLGLIQHEGFSRLDSTKQQVIFDQLLSILSIHLNDLLTDKKRSTKVISGYDQSIYIKTFASVVAHVNTMTVNQRVLFTTSLLKLFLLSTTRYDTFPEPIIAQLFSQLTYPEQHKVLSRFFDFEKTSNISSPLDGCSIIILSSLLALMHNKQAELLLGMVDVKSGECLMRLPPEITQHIYRKL